ncbi:nucleoside hydrolase [Amycolatopsis suaedae]|nr:nucleoside hydrolase [Amycolatopsis suaedae]
MVIDTDPGIDDAVALLYLAAQPGVEIAAVGTVHGNVEATAGARNALQILDVAGLADVPVAIGAARPLAQPPTFAEFIHGADGLGGHGVELADGRGTVEESAAEQLVRLARRHPGELTVLAIGPLTNLALALLLEPRLPALLRSVVVMGGSVNAPGNITGQAEANTAHDPEAADLVYGAGLNLTLVGLDVTETARADAAWLDRLAAATTPRARFASRLLNHYATVYEGLFSEHIVTLHDALAAAIAVDPTLATYGEHVVDVELRGTHTRGRTVVDLRPYRLAGQDQTRPPVRVATAVDAPAFLDRMAAALLD